MSESISNDGFGYVSYDFERVDEDDYSKGYYVSGFVWCNHGSGWYRGLHFDGPDSIDHLIHALVDAKAKAKHRMLARQDDSFMAVRHADFEEKPRHKDGEEGYRCPWCDTPLPRNTYPEYNQGRPNYCPNCGVHFDPKGWPDDGVCKDCAHWGDSHCELLGCYMKSSDRACERYEEAANEQD